MSTPMGKMYGENQRELSYMITRVGLNELIIECGEFVRGFSDENSKVYDAREAIVFLITYKLSNDVIADAMRTAFRLRNVNGISQPVRIREGKVIHAPVAKKGA